MLCRSEISLRDINPSPLCSAKSSSSRSAYLPFVDIFRLFPLRHLLKFNNNICLLCFQARN
jgi:hypothetical protein